MKTMSKVMIMALILGSVSLVNVGTASAKFYPSCVGRHGAAGCTGKSNAYHRTSHGSSSSSTHKFYPSCSNGNHGKYCGGR